MAAKYTLIVVYESLSFARYVTNRSMVNSEVGIAEHWI